MIEKDTVAGIYPIGFAIVDGDPVSVKLCHCVRTARIEGGSFLLRSFLHQAIKFGGTGLIEAGFIFQAKYTNSFKDTQSADAVGVSRIFGRFETHRHVTHGGEVIDFIGLYLLDDADQVGGIGKIAVMQDEVFVLDVRILIKVVDAVGVEERGATFDAMHFVAFLEQKFG